ncbi:MAG TPA: hypothetical protein VE842_07890 [Pyrinomonadaceae bacterium]|nr:hypothetical protein [Pyrinomonadaceae bacterium]
MSSKRVDLRERGIYTFPDGEEFVASVARGGGFALYDPQVWKRYGVPDYEIDAKGRMTHVGQSTHWCIEDLTDTGRTAD